MPLTLNPQPCGAALRGTTESRDTAAMRGISKTSSTLETMSLAAFESAGEAIVITDLTGTIQYVNPAFERISGYRRDEVVGQNPRVLKSGQHSPTFYERLWKTLTSGEVWKGLFLNRRKDGTLYHSEQTIAPIRDVAGKTVGYVSVHEDVTERVRREEHEHAAELRRVRESADQRVRGARLELELAREVQSRLYPPSPIQLPGIDLAGAVVPAEETCGDYFDFLPMPNSRLMIVLGDVSGHGLGPALVMAETRAYLRALAQSTDDVAELLRRINGLLVRDLECGRFVTLFLAILDPTTRSLVYSAAGQPAYHIDRSGGVRQLDNSGMALGLLPDAEIPEGVLVRLQPGDLIFAATDGLHESHAGDGELFGIDRTLDVVRANQKLAAQALIDQVCSAAQQFRQGAPQHDDITVVVVKALES